MPLFRSFADSPIPASLAAIVFATLCGCKAPSTPAIVVLQRCTALDGSAPVSIGWLAPQAGWLRIRIEQRGISAQAALHAPDADDTQATSPSPRAGAFSFVRRAAPGSSLQLRVESQDSATVRGEVCVRVEALSESSATDRDRIRAERAFAAASHEVAQRRWQPASDRYTDAARLFDRIGARRDAAWARSAMAELAYRRFDREVDARALATSALAEFGAAEDSLWRGALLTLIGKIASDNSSPDPRALTNTMALFAAAQRAFDRTQFGALWQGSLDNLRGFANFAHDNAQVARGFFERASASCQKAGDTECFARANQNLAYFAEEGKDSATALRLYGDALAALDVDRFPDLGADVLGNLGRLQGAVSMFNRSEQSMRRALALYSRQSECDGTRRTLSRLGTLLLAVGSVPDALSYLGQAVTLSCRDVLARAAEAGFAAGLTSQVADADQTGWCSRTSAAEVTAESASVLLRAYIALSQSYSLGDTLASAQQCLAKARAFSVTLRDEVQLTIALGSLRLETGDAQGGAALLRTAAIQADRAELPVLHMQRGLIALGLSRSAILLNRWNIAWQQAADALDLALRRSDVGQVIDALRLLSHAAKGQGKEPLSAQLLRVAVDLAEQVPIDGLDADRRVTFLASQHEVFADLTDLLAARATGLSQDARDDSATALAWEAFGASERGRARSIRYALSRPSLDDTGQAQAVVAGRYEALLERLRTLASAAGAGPRMADVEHMLSVIGNSAVTGEAQTPWVARAEFTATLEHLGAVLVEFAFGRERSWAFVADGAQIRVVELAASSVIEHAAMDLQATLRNAEARTATVEGSARRLAELIWWPLAIDPGSRLVLIAPDGALQTIPLAALPWSRLAPGEKVLDHLETVLLPSAEILTVPAMSGRARDTASRFELIGDPVFGAAAWRRSCPGANMAADAPPSQTRSPSMDSGLARLPATRDEIERVAEIIRASRPAARLDVRLGCAATPGALRAGAGSDVALLHVATHGLIDARRPRASVLFFTPEIAQDGLRTEVGLLELVDLQLRPRLAVLSACDTSSGSPLPGEGVLGLAQGLMSGGARSVLGTLWRVDDRLTAEFMAGFYRHLLAERLPASTALRLTQLEAAHRNSGPGSHFWSAFVLLGRPDTKL